jgi:hypothetical protein
MRAATRSSYLLLCLFALAGTASHAQSPTPLPAACPWVTQGSAAKALGAEVSVALNLIASGEGSCTFSHMQKPGEFLKVEVSRSALPSCSADGTKLKGVGNEAMRCTLPGSGDKSGEMISGRVRDLHFVVILVSGLKKAPASSAEAQDDALELIAEQIAGNLF